MYVLRIYLLRNQFFICRSHDEVEKDRAKEKRQEEKVSTIEKYTCVKSKQNERKYATSGTG